MDNEKKVKRFGLWKLVFCLFALIFLVSGGITAKIVLAHHQADKAIQELRIQVQESRSSDMSGDNAAQQPEKPEAAAKGQIPQRKKKRRRNRKRQKRKHRRDRFPWTSQNC